MADGALQRRAVVCFISNYSWLDGLSFTGMRERYLEAFDAVRIDCLNGDKYKTGKVAPDGSPDPSIFSTEGDPVGIQVGTYHDAGAQSRSLPSRRGRLSSSLGAGQARGTDRRQRRFLQPHRAGLPFPNGGEQGLVRLAGIVPCVVSWIKTSRDGFHTSFEARIVDYFNPEAIRESRGAIQAKLEVNFARFATLCRRPE